MRKERRWGGVGEHGRRERVERAILDEPHPDDDRGAAVAVERQRSGSRPVLDEESHAGLRGRLVEERPAALRRRDVGHRGAGVAQRWTGRAEERSSVASGLAVLLDAKRDGADRGAGALDARRQLDGAGLDPGQELDAERTHSARGIARRLGHRPEGNRREVTAVGATADAAQPFLDVSAPPPDPVVLDRSVAVERAGRRGDGHDPLASLGAASAARRETTEGAPLGESGLSGPIASAVALASAAAIAMNSQPSWKRSTGSRPLALASMATRIATPSTKPSWRDIVKTAEPVAKRRGGSDAVAALASDGRVRPTPAPVIRRPGSISPA